MIGEQDADPASAAALTASALRLAPLLSSPPPPFPPLDRQEDSCCKLVTRMNNQ